MKSPATPNWPRSLTILPVDWLKVSTLAETVPSGVEDRFAEQAFRTVGVDLETKIIAAEFPADDNIAGARVWIGLKLGHIIAASKQSTEAGNPSGVAGKTSPLGGKRTMKRRWVFIPRFSV